MNTRKLPFGVKFFFISLFLFFVLGLFNLSSVKAADIEVTLYPTADALVYSGEPYTNYGTMDVLEIGYSINTTYRRLSFTKFDISSIPSTATIQTARFNLYRKICEADMNPNTIYTGQVTSNWTESGITYKTMPNYTVGSFQSGTCGSDNWLSLDVKKLVNNWRSGDANYGLILYSPSTASFLRRYYSRENAGTNIDPKLVITYSLPVISSPSTLGTLEIPNKSSSTTSSGTGTPPDLDVVPPAPTNSDLVDPSIIEPITTPQDSFYPDDWYTNPLISPLYDLFGASLFPCLTLLCCCCPLILLIIIIVLLLTKRKKKEDLASQQRPVANAKVVTPIVESKKVEETVK